MRPVRTDLQGAGTDSAGALESRLTGCSRESFAGGFWGREPLLNRDASDFGDVFSADAVDELISRRGLRTPFLRVAKEGAALPDSSFTSSAGVGATITDQLDDTALWRAFAEGATLVLQALHRTWEPMADLVSALSEELGHPVQANAYVTPPQNRGFDAHYDVHDVFIVQVEGSKRWVIHKPVLPDPLRDQPWTDHRKAVAEAAGEKPYLDTVLNPGDVLYLPRGWLHSAQAQGDVSLHVTLGVHVWTRHALAEEFTRAALAVLREDSAARRSLPLGPEHLESELELVRSRLLEAVAETDVRPRFHRARRSQGRPAPLGPLAQLAALRNLDPTSLIRLRDALAPRWEGARLITRVGWLDFAETDVASVTRLLDGQARTVGELGTALAERLLRAGVLVPAER
ncbi:cupin domain-containing protein [Streptomyces sp. NPDC099088]|uniref:cupin domain-containing protein n=1 Tax=Streptomyces sp. NPDC099088 TaxID=3366101 RepID=UPI003809F19D